MQTITESGITIDPKSAIVYLKQDDDVIIVASEDYEEIRDAFSGLMKEQEPAPEKWYVVLKNSNYQLTNSPNVPTTFTTYSDARIYARNFGGLERTYCPISADEYERAFGR